MLANQLFLMHKKIFFPWVCGEEREPSLPRLINLVSGHSAIGAKVVTTTLDAIGVAATDPQALIALHCAAAGIEEVVVITDLGKALASDQVLVVIDVAIVSLNKAGLHQLALCVKAK